jgi:hypothetical protein
MKLMMTQVNFLVYITTLSQLHRLHTASNWRRIITDSDVHGGKRS